MADMLKITQTRSIIEQLEAAKRTIKALGLGRPNYSVIQRDTPAIRGMLRRVAHLVRVEELKK
ncbi:MAG: 50S ribosomal protein L30 [Ignavibacteriae bacterium]|mgnify:CR=1 FL=1|nr:50S ribosomal protein L30 [Ignavibacteriota bacterium]